MSMVVTQKHGHVGHLLLNRPERRNALGTELLGHVEAAWKSLTEDSDVHVILLSAAGPGFCAGADLKEFSNPDLSLVSEVNLRWASFTRGIGLLNKPVVAAVHGFAMGGGLILAISCDVVITSAATRWQLPEVSLGWLPGFGLQTLAARTGAHAARRITWSTEPMNGTEAQACGIADVLVPDGDDLTATAMAHAQKLAALPPHAVATAKQYFALELTRAGEAMDAVANRMYLADAVHPHAQASMQRFRPK